MLYYLVEFSISIKNFSEILSLGETVEHLHTDKVATKHLQHLIELYCTIYVFWIHFSQYFLSNNKFKKYAFKIIILYIVNLVL